MKLTRRVALLTGACMLMLTLALPGCGSTAAQPAGLADGTYDIVVDTDSSMFRADACVLTAEGGAYTAELVLPGEGFSPTGSPCERKSTKSSSIKSPATTDHSPSVPRWSGAHSTTPFSSRTA